MTARGSRVFAPGVHTGARIPPGLAPLLMTLAAVAVGIGAWAVVDTRRIATDFHAPAPPWTDPQQMRSVAYFDPLGSVDRLYVREVTAGSIPRLVTAFPSAFGTHSRGTASPLGDRLAVLWFDGAAGSHLTFVGLPTGVRTDAVGLYQHLSTLPWSTDGTRVAVVAAVAAERPDVREIHEVRTADGAATAVARFEAVLDVAPVGYSLDDRLFIVVIDQSGSWLWVHKEGKLERVAQMSTGRTRDWELSPEGARLAYIDILGAGGQKAYAGRSMATANGAVVTYASDGDQHGATWAPRAEAPDFGGPGGSVQLQYPANPGDYVIPDAWAPAGDVLVASVFTAGSDAVAPSVASLQLMTADSRIELSGEEGASFIGFVLTNQ